MASVNLIDKNDLTQGNIWKKMSLYFLPLAVGTVFQQLYNAVDGFVVGKYVGTIALAAVGGSATLINNALVNFFVGLTGGGSVLIAQYFGANNKERLSKASHTSILFATICGVGISILGYFMTSTILGWMKTPLDTMEDAVSYLSIIFCGMLFQLLYNMAAGILRAVGDSKSPFVYLSVSCVLNIGLDFLFVAGFKMGVAGAAVATIVSQLICCVLTLRKLVIAKDAPYALHFKEITIDFRLLGRMLVIGGPLGLQSVMYSITNILIQVGLNTLSTAIVAAWALSSRLDGFFWGFMNAANTTISNFIGQNFGKGDYDRMKKGLKVSFVLFMGLTIAYSIVLLVVSPVVIPAFTDDPEVIDLTWQIILFFAPLYFTWTVNEIFSGALRGEGKTLISFIIIALSICVFRLVWLATVFKAAPSLMNLSYCYPISWVLASCAMTIYYVIHIKHKAKEYLGSKPDKIL